MVRAGELRHRVSLLSPQGTAGDAGGIAPGYSEVAEVWAKIESESRSAESDETRGVVSQKVLTVTVRHRDDVDEGWALGIEGDVYEIESILEDDVRARELVMEATRNLGQG